MALAALCPNPLLARGNSDEPLIVVGGQNAKLGEAPFISESGQLYAPVDFVRLMGIGYTVQANNSTVTFNQGARHSVWPCEMVDGTAMVPVAGIARDLGADYAWDQSSQTATIRAKILMVREDNNRLSVDTSFPVNYRVAGIAGPSRVYIDVYNASLAGPYTTVPTDGDDDISQVRANEMPDSVVRITVNLRRPLGYQTASGSSTNHIEVQLAERSAGDGGGRGTAIIPASLTSDPGQAPASDNDSDPDNTNSNGSGSDGIKPAQSPLNPDGLGYNLRRASAAKHILSITTDASHPGEFKMSVVVAGDVGGNDLGYRAFLLSSPSRLAVDFPGTDFAITGGEAATPSCEEPLTTAAAKTLRWGIVKSSSTLISRVVLDLYKPLSYSVATVRQADGSELYTLSALIATKPTAPPLPAPPDAPPIPGNINLPTNNPASADSSAPAQVTPPPVVSEPAPGSGHNVLAGLVIVVDPGHGGYDTGAPGIHGVFEKNIVLNIGKHLRDELVAAGAKVLMTRDDDTFIPLLGRSAMGVQNLADMFVSVHADSVPTRNGATGTTVYYHANMLSSRSLAMSVAQRLTQLQDGIPSRGTMSDFVRYPGVGFSVLRHSPEAAILVETGYVNSDNDEPVLTDSSDQKLIAQGIAAGIKDYFANRGGGIASDGARRGRAILTDK